VGHGVGGLGAAADAPVPGDDEQGAGASR